MENILKKICEDKKKFLELIHINSKNIEIAICKELTKINETVFRGNIKSMIDNKTENKPGKIKATFQPKISTKAPAVKAPKPIPTPPKIPLIPRALPFLSVAFTTQAIPTG